uniref:OCIA domain-containing protein n=1 Tax=Canis lupus familiaris TaxID=9615 RepID=A0A8C0MCH2_CANLF
AMKGRGIVHLKQSLLFRSLPKNTLAGILAFGFGLVSYLRECQDKFHSLEDLLFFGPWNSRHSLFMYEEWKIRHALKKRAIHSLHPPKLCI